MARNVGLLVLTKSAVVARPAALVLLGLLLVLCTPGVANAASAPASWGSPPSGLDQSRCGGMTISPHVVYAGEDVTATTTANTAYCAAPGGTPGQSWSWQYVPGTVVSGCTEDSSTCVWQTGATGGWDEYCMSGAAWVGPWDSCDYYGAVGGASTISVSVSPGSIKADGKSTATVTATVSDSGSPESGDDISFSSSDGGQSIGAVTDNGDGTYTATITASKTAGNATITASDTTPEPAVTATTTLTSTPATVSVSGTVSGISCSETACPRSGASGFTVLVSGTSSDGQSISTTAVTADDGTWSVTVPSGTYTAGISSDGSTFVSKAFEQPVTVGDSPVTGVNFQACDEGASGSETDPAAELQTGLNASPTGLNVSLPAESVLAHADAASFSPSYCQSLYTFKLSASIKQPQIVDPSLKAPFNSSTNPSDPHYSASTSVARFLYRSGFDSLFEAYGKYPSCLYKEEMIDLARHATQVRWYTYMTGGSSLGKISIPLVWNQNTGKADQPQQVVYDPSDEPSSSNGSLTRVWRFIIYPSNGAPVSGSCHLTMPIVPRYFYVPGGSADERKVGGPTSFTIIALWYFPFSPAGETVPPETSAESLIKHLIGEEHGEQLVTAFEKMPWLFRFATTYALASGAAKVAETALEGVAAFGKAVNATAETVKDLKAAANVPEVLHNGHTAYDVIAGMAEGLLEEGHYPVMGAVIRGQFTTTNWVYNASLTQQIPAAETLGLSVKSTSFPDISMSVTRTAMPGTTSSPVWNGLLPWQSGPGSDTTAAPFTANPFQDNPTNLIAHNTQQYLRGRNAVEGIIKATKELAPLGHEVKSTADLYDDFDEEQDLAEAPACSNLGIPANDSTICWKLEDGRP